LDESTIQYDSFRYVKPSQCGFRIERQVAALFSSQSSGRVLAWCVEKYEPHTRGKISDRSIYDKVEQMSDIRRHSASNAVCLPSRAVSLVLALFLLYNPFFTICSTAGPGTAIEHHVSYRSTIASSELGASKLQQHSEVSVEPIVALVATLFDAVRPSEAIVPRPTDQTVMASDGFAPPLWSRPPPTL
jgi:hypothetical protein